jgi:phosphate acetyltransferase
MTGRTLGELAPGAEAALTRGITVETIRDFVAASGDGNPIHSDPAFAATTRFGRVIAPGMLTAGLVSAVIGTRLPGPGTIYLSQELRFLRPVHVGDVVTARVVVAEIVAEKNRLRLQTACVNQGGEAVLEGTAWVMPPLARIEYEAPRASVAAAPAPVTPVAPLVLAPAALGLEVLSWWVRGSLALSDPAFWGWAPARPGTEPDPVRP